MSQKLFLSLFFLNVFLTFVYSNPGRDDRLDCAIEGALHKTQCEERSCIWDHIGSGAPDCYFNKSAIGYNIESNNSVTDNGINGINVYLKVKKSAHLSLPHNIVPIEELKFQVSYLTDRIIRFKITDKNVKRYEVPVQKQFPGLLNDPKEPNATLRKYDVILSTKSGGDFKFIIKRKETATVLWDTSIGGMIFSDQFLQIATYLPSINIYGFGENPHASFRHDLRYKTWPLFAKDQLLSDGPKNAYSVHPFYTCLENDGKSHGVLFLNSNGMDYTLMPSPALNYRTIGGVLDFFMIIGDNPEHVIQLYTGLIGRTFMPPYWGLGYQIARYGFKNLDHIKRIIDSNVKADIPMDIIGLDIDYMDKYLDFTYDHEKFHNLPQYMHEVKKKFGIHWELIWDPEIVGNETHYEAFQDGYHNDIYIKWPKDIPVNKRHNPEGGVPIDTDIMYGRMWPLGAGAYPDFFRTSTHKWWTKWLNYTYKDLNLPFEGMWMDLNEPTSLSSHRSNCPSHNCFVVQCPDNKYDNPPYKIKNDKVIWNGTLCLSAVLGEHHEYRHYDVHSIYGWSQTQPTLKAIQSITGKRSFVLSRSTFPSSGRHSAHWLGDNRSIYEDMHRSIIGLLEFNLFGIPWVGANICGHFRNTTPELCKFWHQLGAFYPFSRNYNSFGAIDQDPASFIGRGHPEVTKDAKRVLTIRYSLLPYLYTLFYISHTNGNTVFRPLFHEFPTDKITWPIDTQFLWGSAILVSPYLHENQTVVNAYLPNDIWYNYYDLKTQTNGWSNFSGDGPFIHIRGGSIIPIENGEPKNSRDRSNSINLNIFCKNHHANGELYYDDEDSIDPIKFGHYSRVEFVMNSNRSLIISKTHSGYDPANGKVIDSVFLINCVKFPINIIIDHKQIDAQHSKGIKKSEEIIVAQLKINLNSKKQHEKWTVTF